MAIRYNLGPALRADQAAAGEMIVHSSTALRIQQEELADELVRQGTTVRRADVLAVLDNLGLAVGHLCARGIAVSIPNLGTMTPRARGVVDRNGTWIRPLEGYLTLQADSRLEAVFAAHAQFEQVPRKPVRAVIRQVLNLTVGGIAANFNPGDILEIKGRFLGFCASAEDEGVFLKHTGGSALSEIKIAEVLHNSHSRLLFRMPSQITSSTWKLEVRARQKDCSRVTLSEPEVALDC